MSDDKVRVAFCGRTSAEFLDEMSRAIGLSLTFENHGAMSENERVAFSWGFRHGVNAINSMLRKAAETDPASVREITDLMEQASKEWALKVRAEMEVHMYRAGDEAAKH